MGRGDLLRGVVRIYQHKTKRTTARYAHLAPSDLSGAFNVIGRIVGSALQHS